MEICRLFDIKELKNGDKLKTINIKFEIHLILNKFLFISI